MRNRANLEEFILFRLKEIKKEYEDYLSQFPQMFEEYKKLNNHLSLLIFDHNLSMNALVGHIDGKHVYTLNYDSAYGDVTKNYSLGMYIENVDDESSIKSIYEKEDEEDDNTER